MGNAQTSWAARLRYQFPALENRNFRLFITGQVISLTGTWMQGPALKWILYEKTNSQQALGVVDFLGQLPVTLLVMAAGVFADRHSRLKVVIGTQFALMVVAAALGTVTHAGFLSVNLIYTFVILGGIAQAFDVPARQALIMEIAGRKTLGNAIALNSATFNSARIIGPSIGGLVLEWLGAAWCFFLNAGSYIAVLAALFSMRNMPERKIDRSHKGLADLMDGMRYVRRHEKIFPLLVLTGAFGLFGNYYMTLLPRFARDVYGKGPKEYGLLIGAVGVGACLGALLTAVKTATARNERRTLSGLLLMCAATLGLAMTTNYVVAVALIAVAGFGMITFLVSSNILVQHLSEDNYVGRVIGVRHFVFGGMFPFGALIAGVLAQRIGERITVAMSALVLLTVTAALSRRILEATVEVAAEPAGEAE